MGTQDRDDWRQHLCARLGCGHAFIEHDRVTDGSCLRCACRGFRKGPKRP
jgi:hypothetical protein